MKKTYELDRDYILDILEEDLDKSTDMIRLIIPKEFQYTFSRLLAARNAIEKINIKNAVENIY